ncbi:PREDICTED: zinc finger CCCH domain-containing protein 30-like [Tarenaya hassleriana]|uniref:zinc finger CCCH domain-containing protein 30-like n=1 Tax=Tarenaya hassleriana TaxID=28532 RepID=UPI00053C1D27|nr:PREDICTED: zinc finger CCCH domain-containing protein 30-like [Tarenaya hassleriana]
MCCGSDRLNLILSSRSSTLDFIGDNVLAPYTDMNHLTVETEDTFASLLELAANNDVEGFRLSLVRDPSCVDEVGLWYGRQKGSRSMVNDQRTPLMVAATYGSIDVIKLIISFSDADVNRTCGNYKTTALHSAASGGAVNAGEVVKLLLAAGADPNLPDADGRRAVDVVMVPPKLEGMKLILQELLSADGSMAADRNLRVVTGLPHSPDGSPPDSPLKFKSPEAKREYPVDPSLPDIKNSIYSTDEFRMYSFKVRPCSRAYSHDWTECPFVHPGENARRRDPRKFHYSCVPCPDFRKGACRRGDMCEYAHGVFECWLHPAQYRTRLCKDGTGCGRRVCFFAHTPEELRPLYVSTGSAIPSPRSSSDFAAAMSLLPGSPSSVSVMSPSPFTPPPMSPSGAGNGMSHSNMAWPQPNVPALHLPGSNLQSSRLRSSLNARDIPAEDFNMLPDYDRQQLMNEFSGLSSNSLSRSGRMKSMNPSNLDDLFSAESSSSPRFTDPAALASAVFSPTHKSAVFKQFQQQNMLSPINTNFSPKNIDHSLLQTSFAGGRMSPRNSVEPISPLSSRVSMLAQLEKQQQQQHQFRSLSSRELRTNSSAIVGSPVNSPWSNLGSSNGKPDWTVSSEEFGKLRRSSSFELGNGDEPDLSWVQSLVKESPTDMKEKASSSSVQVPGPAAENKDDDDMNMAVEPMDRAVLGAWIEQLQLDQLVAQQN